MHFKNKLKDNGLIKVFDYDGFSLHSFKNHLAEEELSLGPFENKEMLVFSLRNEIIVNGERLSEKDTAYIPITTKLNLSTPREGSVVFIAESLGKKKYEFYVKRYSESQRMSIGKPTFRRTVIITIGENEKANRFIAGYVEDSLGEWTSYPPHKHDGKPEAYIYYGIDPGFAVQLVLDESDERAYVVHDYDTVLIPRGYHPQVNTSNGGSYAWIISAPPNERNLAVEIHPAFRQVDLGKSHLSIS